jgi:hypothetical protein
MMGPISTPSLTTSSAERPCTKCQKWWMMFKVMCRATTILVSSMASMKKVSFLETSHLPTQCGKIHKLNHQLPTLITYNSLLLMILINGLLNTILHMKMVILITAYLLRIRKLNSKKCFSIWKA